MATFRVSKNSNYSTISNAFLNDEQLSWKAKGLLTWLLTRPDNWKIFSKDLQTRSTDGRDSTNSAIEELIKNGYIERISIREKGIYRGYDYTVYESPPQDNRSGKPAAVNPNTENPQLVITELSKDLTSNKKINKKGLDEVNGVEEVFEFWQTTMGKQKAHLDSKRRKIIEARLREYSIEELKQAIIGCTKSSFHMGYNAQQTAYNQISNIFGSPENTEKFIEQTNTKRLAANSHDLSTQDYDNAQEHFDVPVNQANFAENQDD